MNDVSKESCLNRIDARTDEHTVFVTSTRAVPPLPDEIKREQTERSPLLPHYHNELTSSYHLLIKKNTNHSFYNSKVSSTKILLSFVLTATIFSILYGLWGDIYSGGIPIHLTVDADSKSPNYAQDEWYTSSRPAASSHSSTFKLKYEADTQLHLVDAKDSDGKTRYYELDYILICFKGSFISDYLQEENI